MGYSRGCAGVYRYAAYKPQKVSSIVALAGKKALEHVPDLVNIPILLIHGENDTHIPFNDSMDMYKAFKESGSIVEFIPDSGDHYIPSNIFSRKDIYQWQHDVT